MLLLIGSLKNFIVVTRKRQELKSLIRNSIFPTRVDLADG